MGKRASYILVILFNYISFVLLSCNSANPPQPPQETKPTLALAFYDASCTEAWLQLQTKDLTLPAELILKQYNPTGDSVTKIVCLSTKDSLLYIDSLLPNKTYKFKIAVNTTSRPQPITNEVELTTMDTTSHDFTFQSWTFGTIGSSVLYDVAIINENDIWAVGQIMIADTSINGYTTYNAVHWDGGTWTLYKLYFYTIPGQQDTGVYEARSIFAFDANNIWITSGSQITKWNGVRQINRQLTSVYANKLWGTNNNNIYAVGINGQIAHYNGANWQRIESGTTLNINDILGDYNEKTQQWEILAVAGNKLQGSENKILRILENNTSTQLNSSGTAWPLRTLWFKASKKYFVAGSGVFNKNKITEINWKECILDISINSTNRIRGLNINEIIAVGGFGEMLHFNGYSWVSFIDQTGLSSGNYLGVDLKGELCIAVGQNNSNAVITKGKK